MEFKKIKYLLNLMEKNNLSKINYEDENFKIKLEKNIDNNIEIEESTDKNNSTENWVVSPLSGIYINREKQLKIGQRVSKGEVLFKINSMKILNDIVSPKDGIILEVLALEGDLLEFNQKVIKLGDL